jgi:hypothetical protein
VFDIEFLDVVAVFMLLYFLPQNNELFCTDALHRYPKIMGKQRSLLHFGITLTPCSLKMCSPAISHFPAQMGNSSIFL